MRSGRNAVAGQESARQTDCGATWGISAAGVVAAVALSGLAGADDGALSRAEVEGTLPGVAGAFEELDLDGDGKLTSFKIHHPSGHDRHPAGAAMRSRDGEW